MTQDGSGSAPAKQRPDARQNRYAGMLKPPPDLSEIADGLWQGKRPLSYSGWDMVVSCEEHLARRPAEGWRGLLLHLPMRDEDDWPLDADLIQAAAEAAMETIGNSRRVLVHCTGGLNRSSVVTAEILICMGLEPEEAVRELRLRHDPWCLCNRAFERFVLRQPLPIVETSVFRADLREAESASSAAAGESEGLV